MCCVCDASCARLKWKTQEPRDVAADHKFEVSSSEAGKILTGGLERESFVSEFNGPDQLKLI